MAATLEGAELDLYLVPETVPYSALDCKAAFEGLTADEKKYCHHLAAAGWAGWPICLAQLSPEAPALFRLLHAVFSAADPAALRERAAAAGEGAGATAAEVEQFVQYAAYFFANAGNYLSFGDTKFIPRLPADAFRRVVRLSGSAAALALVDEVLPAAYSLEPSQRALGLDGQGVSTYYSPGMATEDVKLVQRFMEARGISAYNTRLFKQPAGGFELRLASANVAAPQTHDFEGTTITVTTGDYAEQMAQVVAELRKARAYAANDHERAMLDHYVVSFETGSIDAHKDAQRAWIKDVGPTVETNIGFIESYRDPFGVRGEWEGFVAVVNKEMSARFGRLVAEAERFLPLLPWGRALEKDTFLRPDFTSLEVVAFASSGVPAGINIPNYDDIRQAEGFKNVSLGNVLRVGLSGGDAAEAVSFVRDDEQALYHRLATEAFEVQVGLHELLGHGSGKLLSEAADGTKNFDPAELPWVTSWYKPGETYDAKFPVFSSALEECRAECVGIFLCVVPEILAIFGHGDGAAAAALPDVAYVNWLIMVRAGLRALEFYTPETKQWRQAHMQARFAILRTLLNAGQGLVELVRTGDDVRIHLDRSKIQSVGVGAIGAFLDRIQRAKATADYAAAKELFEAATAVDDHFLDLRRIALAKKTPRRQLVQAVTRLEGDAVTLEPFEGSADGIIRSFVARYPAVA